MSLILPGNYESRLDIRETEIAIKKVKDYFERTSEKEQKKTQKQPVELLIFNFN